jgi:hypothetical protein
LQNTFIDHWEFRSFLSFFAESHNQNPGWLGGARAARRQMDGARRFIEGIASRQQCLRLTFDVKTKFSLEDVAENETGMNVLGRSEPVGKIS